MADSTVIAQSITVAGAPFAIDLDGSGNAWPYAKLAFGASGTQTHVEAATPLPVQVLASTVTVQGAVSLSAVGHVIVDSGNLGGVTSIGTIANPLPAGTNNLGTVGQSGTWVIAGVTSIGAVNAVTSVGVVNAITSLGSIVAALPAGTNNLGTVGQSGTWNIAGVTSIGAVNAVTSVGAVNAVTSLGSIVAALPAGGNSIGMTQNIPGTTGGLLRQKIPLAAGLGLTLIKGSAGQFYFVSGQHIAATPVYVKVFDVAGTVNVTMGTTAADYQFMLPANATPSLGAGIAFPFDPGINHTAGIVVALTGGIALADNTSLAASVAVVTVGYK